MYVIYFSLKRKRLTQKRNDFLCQRGHKQHCLLLRRGRWVREGLLGCTQPQLGLSVSPGCTEQTRWHHISVFWFIPNDALRATVMAHSSSMVYPPSHFLPHQRFRRLMTKDRLYQLAKVKMSTRKRKNLSHILHDLNKELRTREGLVSCPVRLLGILLWLLTS